MRASMYVLLFFIIHHMERLHWSLSAVVFLMSCIC